jgi:ribosomal protein L40E
VLRRCCSTRRDNAVAARIATALLQQALRQRCGAALARVATTLRRCSSSQQRRKAAHYATMASGSSARGNNR